MSEQSQTQTSINITDTKVWKLLAWVLGIIGAIIVLVAGPKDDPGVKKWVKNSIAFFIVGIIAYVVGWVLALIPFIGSLIYWLIILGLVIIWAIGILKILQDEDWTPPFVTGIAEKINI